MSKCLIGNISKEILEDVNIEYSYLSDLDLDTDMKDLVLEKNLMETKLTLPSSFVYMFDYEDTEMSRITQELKSHGIRAVYVASTQHNLLWTLKDLLNEVMKEHQMFQTIDRLKHLIQDTMKLPIDENKENIEKALMASFIALQGKDLNTMKQMIKELEKYHKKSD